MSNETIKDLMPQTPDLNSERIAKLKELFPDLFTGEGQLDENELRKLVAPNSVNEIERYEFRWFGKSRAKRDAFTPSKATLVFDETRSMNPLAAENLIIEGENLEVLKLLLCAYRGGIKCIYIDPPYNTGNDFVYNDNYTEGRKPYWEQTGVTENGVRIDTNADTDGRFHSNWMNMMYSRLLAARQLLKPDGVIFISIDDHEVHNLRRLCDEVFGEENFAGQIVWKRRASTALAEKNISSDHEYVICYQKSDEFEGFAGTDKNYSSYSNPDNDPRGDWTLGDLTVGMGRDLRPNQYYDLVNPKTGKVYKPNPNRVWAYIPESMSKLIEEDRIYFPDDTSKRPMLKRFKENLKSAKNPISTFVEDVGYNSEGTREIQSVFGGSVFNYSKPVSLLSMLLSNTCSTSNNTDDNIILDFFGGSGTTGQAVMELNEEDGGNRKFILVQLPELTDEKSEAYKAGFKKLSDITIERNRRVVERLIAERKQAHPNLFKKADQMKALKGLGFKVFRLEKSYFPRTDWSPDPMRTEAENVIALKQYIAEKESQLNLSFDRDKLLTEILLKEEGFKLNFKVTPYAAVTLNQVLHVTDGDKEALICLDPTIELETVEHFKTQAELKFICLERALDTTKKWNLHHFLGEKFKAF